MAAGLVIFDCDGVLVDSDRIALRIQAERITALGLPTTYEDCVRDFLGLGMPGTLRIIEERLGEPLPVGWAEGLDGAVRDAFERELTPVEGVVAALDQIELPTCIASSGSQEKMRFTLGLTGLHERFGGRIFSAEEVERGKPAPDLFLHAAARIGVSPERCVAVEDSSFGVAGAVAAGMTTLGYAPEGRGEVLAQAGATVFGAMGDLPGLIRSARSSPGPSRRPG
ncbi:MAG: HAD family hydrolase [Actinobacteria bacterium]|nr:HAD family hydrolase [Actinomycetota bacterium]